MYSWRQDVFINGKVYLWRKDVFRNGKCIYKGEEVFIYTGDVCVKGKMFLMKGKMYLRRGICTYEGEYVFMEAKVNVWKGWNKDLFMKRKIFLWSRWCMYKKKNYNRTKWIVNFLNSSSQKQKLNKGIEQVLVGDSWETQKLPRFPSKNPGILWGMGEESLRWTFAHVFLKGRCIYEGEDVFWRRRCFYGREDVLMKPKITMWKGRLNYDPKMCFWKGK